MTGCLAAEEIEADAVAMSGQAVVVGADNRMDVFEHPSAALRALAASSTVGLVSKHSLDTSNPDDVVLYTGTPENLCPDERFYGQAPGAYCSGTLIADDLVLTAGHCISAASCGDTAFVFDFRQESASARATITENDVYHCAEVIVRRDIPEDHLDPHDHAIVRLDRSATPWHTPAPVVTAVEELPLGAALTVIGHPNGLPTKIADGGSVVARYDDWSSLGTTLDISAGNSGSGAFDSQGRVVGIVTHGSGETFYDDGTCRRWQSEPEGQDRGGVRYVFWAIREMCSVIDHALCGAAQPVCGDEVCEPRESHDGCAQDCLDLPPFYDPNASTLTAQVVVDQSWSGGYCGRLLVQNGGATPTTWQAVVSLNGSQLTSLWDGVYSLQGSLLTVSPPGWQSPLVPDATHAVGFCATRADPAALPSVVSVQ